MIFHPLIPPSSSVAPKKQTGELEYGTILDALEAVGTATAERNSPSKVRPHSTAPPPPSSSSSSSSSRGEGPHNPSSSSCSSSSGAAKKVFFSDAEGYIQLGSDIPASAPTPAPPAPAPTETHTAAPAPPPVTSAHPETKQLMTFGDIHNPSNFGLPIDAPAPTTSTAVAVNSAAGIPIAGYEGNNPNPIPIAGYKGKVPPHLTASQHLSLSAPEFQASLASMLFPNPKQEELQRSARGRGQYFRSQLVDHITHEDGVWTAAPSPSRPMSGTGRHTALAAQRDHNNESCDLGDIFGTTPYHTEGAVARRPALRMARKKYLRSTSAPSGHRAKSAGTHYAYFYGSNDDSVCGVMSHGHDGRGGGSEPHHVVYRDAQADSFAFSDEQKGDDEGTRHHIQTARHNVESDPRIFISESVEYTQRDSLQSQSGMPGYSQAPSSQQQRRPAQGKHESAAQMAARLRENAILTQVPNPNPNLTLTLPLT